MKLADYDRAVILSVDTRYPEFPDRVKALLKPRGVDPIVYLNGRGVEGLDRNLYRLVHEGDVPAWWTHSRGCWDCLKTYRAVVAEAVADGVDSLLILEDDVHFTGDFDDVVESAEVPEDWQSLSYGSFHNWSSSKPVPVGKHVVRLNGSVGTHCVGYRRGAMQAILRLPITTTMDSEMAQVLHPAMPCYCLTPSVARQREGVVSYVVGGDPFYGSFLYDV